MIGLPRDDQRGLGSITEVVAELVATRDPVIAMMASEFTTTRELASFIRSLPARRAAEAALETTTPARVRVPAPDPTSLERAALYIAVAELIDPTPVRRFASVDTSAGAHAYPVEDGAPIVLDPRAAPAMHHRHKHLRTRRHGETGGAAWLPLIRGLAETVDWSLDVASGMAGPYPEEVAAIERVRRYVRSRLAGEPADLHLDDLLLTFGIVVAAIDRGATGRGGFRRRKRRRMRVHQA